MSFSPNYAEQCPYWKTSKSGPSAWMDRTRKIIEDVDGIIHGCGEVLRSGITYYAIEFVLQGDRFTALWPVLESEHNETSAARRQAATMLFHDVKNRVVAAKVHGFRFAFLHYLALPDGRTVSEVLSTGTQQLKLPPPAENVA